MQDEWFFAEVEKGRRIHGRRAREYDIFEGGAHGKCLGPVKLIDRRPTELCGGRIGYGGRYAFRHSNCDQGVTVDIGRHSVTEHAQAGCVEIAWSPNLCGRFFDVGCRQALRKYSGVNTYEDRGN